MNGRMAERAEDKRAADAKHAREEERTSAAAAEQAAVARRILDTLKHARHELELTKFDTVSGPSVMWKQSADADVRRDALEIRDADVRGAILTHADYISALPRIISFWRHEFGSSADDAYGPAEAMAEAEALSAVDAAMECAAAVVHGQPLPQRLVDDAATNRKAIADVYYGVVTH